MNAKEIIEINDYKLLFKSSNATDLKKEYVQLAKQFHPDIYTGDFAGDIMKHINSLYERAEMFIKTGSCSVCLLVLKDSYEKLHKIKYIVNHPFELGEMYIGNHIVVYVLNKEHAKFAQRYKDNVSSFTYPDEKIKNDIEKYLPKILDSFRTEDGREVIVVKKTKDLILLRDVLNYLGSVPDKHVAWITSSLINIACYLEFSEINHCGITLDTCFISPVYHSVALLGGWWYAIPNKTKLIGTTGDIYSVMPNKCKENKTSNSRVDLEAIRLIGRQLLGSKTGTKFNGLIPKPICSWFTGISEINSFKEYLAWSNTLTEAYGKRTFVEFNISCEDIYKMS